MGDDVAVVLDRRGHVAGDGLKLFARALKFRFCSDEKQIKHHGVECEPGWAALKVTFLVLSSGLRR